MLTDEQKSAILQQQYNKLQSDIADIQEQLGVVSSQLQEHVIVDRTLSAISPEKRAGRKCFKMIGGVLVEKSIDEVIKLLDSDVKKLQEQRKVYEKTLGESKSQLEKWIKSNNIKIMRS